MASIEAYLVAGSNAGASDIYVNPGSPVMFRIEGEMVPANGPAMREEEALEMARPYMDFNTSENLEMDGVVDFVYSIVGFRPVRFHLERQEDGYHMSLCIGTSSRSHTETVQETSRADSTPVQEHAQTEHNQQEQPSQVEAEPVAQSVVQPEAESVVSQSQNNSHPEVMANRWKAKQAAERDEQLREEQLREEQRREERRREELAREAMQQLEREALKEIQSEQSSAEATEPVHEEAKQQAEDLIEHYLREGSAAGASDIHITPGTTVMFRVDGELVHANGPVIQANETFEMVKPYLTEEQIEELEENGELDFAYSVANFHRVRFNVYRQRGSYAMALRILASEIPEPSKLGIPEAVLDLTNRKRGLVLVTGPTGSGKSTTLAALIHIIAEKYPKTIITLEDPIEYLHPHSKAIVMQREIGYDSKTYASALRAALREDPDVILVGEMRDLETINIAITAAETGHLVFSTLHTNSAAATIDRVIDVFPPHQQPQVRVQLASVIEGVIAQQLLPKNGGGRVAAYEVMLATPAIRNLIREGKSFQIPSMIQTNRKVGMQAMDDVLYDLYSKSMIAAQDAVSFAQDQSAMSQKVTIF